MTRDQGPLVIAGCQQKALSVYHWLMARKACQQRRERYYEQRPINLALQQKDAENKGPGNPVPVTSGLNKRSQNTENKQDTLLCQKFTNSLLVDSLSSQLLNSPDKQRNTLSIQTKGETGLYTRFCW
jgi:hypothetical protein